MPYVITDLGEAATLVNVATGEETVIPRYGVWDHEGVIETGDDVEALKAKYSVEVVHEIRPMVREK